MATSKNKRMAFGLFRERASAETAIAELRQRGFANDDIGLMYRNAEGDTVRKGAENKNLAAEGAAVGAGAGALGGALVGLGVWTGVIPIVGPVLAMGAIGTVLLNAAGGAAITGLAGALVGAGIPEEDAKYYEDQVKAGRTLVSVRVGDREEEALDILAGNRGMIQVATS